MNTPWRLDSRRALVTGGSSGIGLAVAQEFAALGAELVLVARDPDRLDRARSAILDVSPKTRVEVIAADLSRDADRRRVAAAAGDELQVLVNNAGTNIRKRMTEFSLEDYRQVQAANIESCFEMCRLLHPLLQRGQPASVVNNVSISTGLATKSSQPARAHFS